jgi:hypothetical protein
LGRQLWQGCRPQFIRFILIPRMIFANIDLHFDLAKSPTGSAWSPIHINAHEFTAWNGAFMESAVSSSTSMVPCHLLSMTLPTWSLLQIQIKDTTRRVAAYVLKVYVTATISSRPLSTLELQIPTRETTECLYQCRPLLPWTATCDLSCSRSSLVVSTTLNV